LDKILPFNFDSSLIKRLIIKIECKLIESHDGTAIPKILILLLGFVDDKYLFDWLEGDIFQTFRLSYILSCNPLLAEHALRLPL
jgi:hypothetical protein